MCFISCHSVWIRCLCMIKIPLFMLFFVKFLCFAQEPPGGHECAARRLIFHAQFSGFCWEPPGGDELPPSDVALFLVVFLCSVWESFWLLGNCCINHIRWFTITILITFVRVLILWEIVGDKAWNHVSKLARVIGNLIPVSKYIWLLRIKWGRGNLIKAYANWCNLVFLAIETILEKKTWILAYLEIGGPAKYWYAAWRHSVGRQAMTRCRHCLANLTSQKWERDLWEWVVIEIRWWNGKEQSTYSNWEWE